MLFKFKEVPFVIWILRRIKANMLGKAFVINFISMIMTEAQRY